MKIQAGCSIILLFLFFVVPVSGMKVDPAEPLANTTLTVSGIPPGADVQFVLNGATPEYGRADGNGNASFLPLLPGTLEIIVTQDGRLIDSKVLTVKSSQSPQPTQTSGSTQTIQSSTSGGSGGLSAVSSEPLENILTSEKKEKNLIANSAVTFEFTSKEHSIEKILVTGKDNEVDISIKVEVLKGVSKQVTSPPPGIVFKNINIISSTKRMQEAVIRFKVDNSWITANNIETIQMLKWSGNSWLQFEAKELSKDELFTYFETKTQSFSVFAITGISKVEEPQTTQTQEDKVTPEKTEKPAQPQASPGKRTAGFELISAMIAIILLYKIRVK